MKELVEKLKKIGVLKSTLLIESFLQNDRAAFVSPEHLEDAYVDAPLPIGNGQTISQPFTVAFMLELLQPRPAQRILDIGFGSGWTTALLTYIAGKAGRVFGLEIVPELFARGRTNLEKFAYSNVELYNQSGWEGLPEAAPFDRILVSAAAHEIPKALKEQLTIGGRMVIPVGGRFGQSVRLVVRVVGSKFEEEDHPGFVFVPFVKQSR